MAPLFSKRPEPTHNTSGSTVQPSQQPKIQPQPSRSNELKRPTTTAMSTRPEPPKRVRRDAALESMPLAAKVRPVSLSEFVGQEELLGDKGVLRALMQSDRIPSMILWGPPGCGKTTVARIISKTTKSRFIELSATSHGAADVKKAFEEARGHLSLTGQKTIIFIDEIHRFTKAQQDLFLPYVEQGTIHLIGATTENPSFKVNSALLSRCRVFVLKRLSEEHLTGILSRAVQHWRSDGNIEARDGNDAIDEEEPKALSMLAVYSDGDARNALNTLEIALSILPSKSTPLQVETVKGAFQKSHLLYDRNGEEHYNIISALHKSIRGSDADAALYWLARMLEAGEDPLYVARRLVRCASEDIGLADNAALPLAVSAYQACEKIGMPECDTILAHLVTYLAETKKSVRTYKAYNMAKATVRQQPNYPVPLHIRNAPTKLMKDIGYGDGYKYNPDYDEPVDQFYMPDELSDAKFLDAQ
ncbi:DNA polymerase III, clamp loader complex, gamma/delta/delta subunit [Zychaea mexicana]|uniref:DNA polymerase III, clamp loader complex, gamma/delta/delta subunit n=1 Tax=Zychaea mexicana TaxID=64656 RepID=UPI0022FEE6D7|nr:DNA polymerase III, clamp loader complex, gamma/delta/delta subunit [Zychaea mexicana]KAI9498181.1 DNA polymerase III, clamp loader complex, gamma/delta/delta subunit [Zychaea mexicana]